MERAQRYEEATHGGLAGRLDVHGRGPLESLMLAVLEDAVACCSGSVRVRRENRAVLRRQAVLWMTCEDWKSPFSFRNVCEALRLDASAVRARVLGSRVHDRAA